MNNINRKLAYTSLENDLWIFESKDETIEVTLNGETKVYDIKDINKIEHDCEYIFLYVYGTGEFYQLKFEENQYLVIDKFDSEGEHIDTIGSHVFGEENS